MTHDNYNELTDKIIFLLFINDNHYDYLKYNDINFSYFEELIYKISKKFDINLKEKAFLNAKIYPISLRSSPDVYNEMFEFWKSQGKKLPDERFEKTSNKYLYKNIFISLAYKKYCLEQDRLYYIKELNYIRYNDGSFQDINKVKIKKIHYIYEIYPSIKNIHDNNNHPQISNIIDAILNKSFYFDSMEFINLFLRNYQCLHYSF